MVKYVLVKEAPNNLRDGEYLITMPDFLEEIRLSSARNNRKTTSASQLRSIANLIAINYDKDFDVLRMLKAHDFEGIAFQDDEALSRIVLGMLEATRPEIFDKYIDHKIKTRPFGTKLIYFVGPHEKTTSFTLNGIDSLNEKDVDAHLGLKTKRVFGKPAVTKEEAENAEKQGQSS